MLTVGPQILVKRVVTGPGPSMAERQSVHSEQLPSQASIGAEDRSTDVMIVSV